MSHSYYHKIERIPKYISTNSIYQSILLIIFFYFFTMFSDMPLRCSGLLYLYIKIIFLKMIESKTLYQNSSTCKLINK